MIYSIYEIRCVINDMVYFGRSQEVEKRWRAHRNLLRKNVHNNHLLQNDWNTYGEDNFKFTILEELANIDESIKIEQLYIDDSQYNKYNISDAKMGGDTFTNNPRKDQIRKLKSANSSGKNNPMYGKPKSEKMITRVKEANSKPIMISQVIYPSITEASKILNIGITTITYRLKANTFPEWKYL